MAETRIQIDAYRLYHLTFDNISTDGVVCRIDCYARTKYMGTLYFYKNKFSISGGSYVKNGKLGLKFRESQLANIIETLRQEKPLYIWYNDVAKIGGLDTSLEPVGEEEL